MAAIFRGISGSQYVYWDNVTTFMPVGTINITEMDDGTGPGSSAGSQITLYQRVSSALVYQYPTKPPLAIQIFLSNSRNGVDYSNNNRTFSSTNSGINSALLGPFYNDILYTGSFSASNAFVGFKFDTINNSFTYSGLSGTSTLFNSTTSFCIEMLFSASVAPSSFWYGLIGNYNGSTVDTNNLWWRATDQKLQHAFTYYTPDRASHVDFNIASNTTLVPGAWYHLVLQNDFTVLSNPALAAITSSMYINGILDSQISGTITSSWRMTNSRPYYIGCNSLSTDIFNGIIPSVKFYNPTLTANDVLQIYSNSFIGIINNGL